MLRQDLPWRSRWSLHWYLCGRWLIIYYIGGPRFARSRPIYWQVEWFVCPASIDHQLGHHAYHAPMLSGRREGCIWGWPTMPPCAICEQWPITFLHCAYHHGTMVRPVQCSGTCIRFELSGGRRHQQSNILFVICPWRLCNLMGGCLFVQKQEPKIQRICAGEVTAISKLEDQAGRQAWLFEQTQERRRIALCPICALHFLCSRNFQRPEKGANAVDVLIASGWQCALTLKICFAMVVAASAPWFVTFLTQDETLWVVGPSVVSLILH